ncbi:MAG: YeeE/YedE family protein [Saprospiraceae bacterium]|nr:YeeE/YedE family protein [Saprospiraceae bacterium]MBL0294760.1 YeeE/YedE family protein [Saprospiraceae bacterium]
MLEIIRQPWHWSIAGLLIGLTVPTLLLIGNKKFGVSSSLRHLCAMCVPANIPFFQYEWKKEIWNLFFVGGMLIGALIASKFLHNPSNIVVAESTKTVLYQYGITDFSKLMPTQIFNVANIFTLKGFAFFVFGGFLVGFGTRYAGGCTSGHSIMGLSTLQWPSLVATICFMIGGFFSANIIIPFIFKLF